MKMQSCLYYNTKLTIAVNIISFLFVYTNTCYVYVHQSIYIGVAIANIYFIQKHTDATNQ